MIDPLVDVRRGGDRFRTAAPGLDSRHSFSYGRHYDPDNLGFGLLMAHNEDRLSPGAGFDRHLHRGLDIVSWVLSGTLEHEHWTDRGQIERRERLTAGMAQVLRTGSGADHAERASSDDVHYVQMWLASATPEAEPGYERHDFTAALAEATTAPMPKAVTVASGRADPTGLTLALSQPGAELSVARLPAGTQLQLPPGPLAHVFIARGVVGMDGMQLVAGDALRLGDAPTPTLIAVKATEVLLWTQARGLR